MPSDDFAFLSNLLKRRSGLVLTPDKLYLVESRLMPIARKEGLADIAALISKLRQPGSETLQRAVTDAMTTNESLFFRDKTPFEHFEKVIVPSLLPSRPQKRLRVWCAAASTGQEPYSLVLTMAEKAAQFPGLSLDILGTDICAEVIARAQAGIYSQFEVQRGLPIQMLVKYFTKEGDNWRLKENIRQQVKYKLFNLLESLSALGQFDVVFCRNVLIYFDRDTKADIITRIAKILPEDGYLILGAAETVVGLTVPFQPHPTAKGLYVKAAAAALTPPAKVAAG
ncbi:MAG: protein-glutamate O-methyltransferase CheR [Alphaproteobacteria bacterium]|nr:protein-glutamate O-methyltransferase CheR [Alphaproteobacteria bacterium]